MSKFMRMIVFFDLPVGTARERNFLIKDGYHMVQYSVYSRICHGNDAVEMHETRLKQHLPSRGSIRLLTITEKQYESIHILLGEAVFDDTSEATELINIF